MREGHSGARRGGGELPNVPGSVSGGESEAPGGRGGGTRPSLPSDSRSSDPTGIWLGGGRGEGMPEISAFRGFEKIFFFPLGPNHWAFPSL